MTIFLILLTLHFIGDFLLQTDRMATRKSYDSLALLQHVTLYGVPFAAFTLLTVSNPMHALWFTSVTMTVHFFTDFVTSRITSRLWFFARQDGVWEQASYHYPKHGETIVNPWLPLEGKRHWFFVMIGFDQLLHAYALAAVWALMLRL